MNRRHAGFGDEHPGRAHGLYVGFYSTEKDSNKGYTGITWTLIDPGQRSAHATHSVQLHAHERAFLAIRTSPRSESHVLRETRSPVLIQAARSSASAATGL